MPVLQAPPWCCARRRRRYLPFTGFLNPESVEEIAAYIEAAANDLPAESRRQSERLGDFVTDRKKR